MRRLTTAGPVPITWIGPGPQVEHQPKQEVISNSKHMIQPKTNFSLDQITVVTCFFNLSKLESGRPRNVEQYLELCKHVLQLPVNLFIVTDPDLGPWFWNYRKRLNLLDKTYIYSMKLKDSPYYRHLDLIKNCYKINQDGNTGFPQGLNRKKDTPLYVILGWTRYWLLQQAASFNPFNSEALIWMDCGLFHLYKDRAMEMRNLLLDNLSKYMKGGIRLMLLQDTHLFEIEDRKKYYSSRVCKTAAGLFGGDLDKMIWFSQQFNLEVKKCLNSGYPNLDEALANAVYTEHKDQFDPYYGDYHDLIPNFNGYQQNLWYVAWTLEHSVKFKLWNLMLKECPLLIECIEQTDNSFEIEEVRSIYQAYIDCLKAVGQDYTELEAKIRDLIP